MVAEEGQRYLPVSDEKVEEEEEEEDSEELHVPSSRAVATKFTVCGRFSACMRMTIAGLPLCFLMLYVLDAFILTFPDTAYMHLINEELEVSQSDQSIFYATIMVPWYFKPFYGWIVSRGYSPVSSSSSSSSSSASNHDTAPTSPSNVSFTRLSKYIIAASVGSAASYLLTSTAVYSLTNLYLATLLRALSNAFSELCLGVILVSFAEATSRKRVGVMQSAASGARAAGSLLAYVLAIPLYPCHQEETSLLSARAIIGVNSAVCLLAALFAVYFSVLIRSVDDVGGRYADNRAMQDSLLSSVTSDGTTTNPSSSSPACQNRHKIERKHSLLGMWLVLAMTLAAGFGIFWISQEQQGGSLREHTPPGLWNSSFGVACCVFVMSGLCMLRDALNEVERDSRDLQSLRVLSNDVEEASFDKEGARTVATTTTGEISSICSIKRCSWWRRTISTLSLVSKRTRIALSERWKHIQWRSIMPAIFLFAFNATPSAEIQWSNMTYNIFEKKLCYVQYSSVISMTASTIGAALYARVCNKRPTHVAIVFATCLSVCAGLLRLPLALEWNNFVGANHDDDMCGQPGSNGFFRWMYEDTFASDCTDVAFEYLAVATTIMGIFSQCAMVPLIVLAVERCPLSKAGVWYGMFLASMSLGVSVSGWVTAPLVSKLGITFNNFEGLGSLILIESASKIAMLLLIPLLALNGAILAPCSSIVPKSPHRRSSSDVPRDAHCRDKKSYELNDGTKACSSEDEDNAILAFARNATTDARFHARLSEPILLGIPRGRSH